MIKLIFDNPVIEGWRQVKGARYVRKAAGIVFEIDQHDDCGDDHCWDIIRDAKTNRIIARRYEVGSWWIVGNYTYDRLRIEAS